MTARRSRLSDGRWHFQHGPIDLVIQADGDTAALAEAHAHAWSRFETILDELVAELPRLKRPVDARDRPRGDVARRMADACLPHAGRFITPMAAVAGAVADTIVASYRRDGVRRASINNGGDIAIHLAPGQSFRIGLVADLASFDASAWNGSVAADATFEVDASMPVRGIATSGWRGRSFSLGIADSVTVLARTAAEADAAATMIANAVDVDDPRILRAPASSRKDDSDLGDRLVTVGVPTLSATLVDRALAAGLAHAQALRSRALIEGCILACQGRYASTSLNALEGLAA